MSNIERNNNLQKTLQSAAASSNYVQTLDSYLYDYGKRRSPSITKFYVQTVDDIGQPTIYTVNGVAIVGIVLSINPASISINASKIVNRTQTMSGWVEDHWGEELDTVTFQGSSAAFMWHGPNAEVPTNIQAPLKQTTSQTADTYKKYENIQDLGITSPQGIGQQSGLAVTQRRQTATYKEFKTLMQLMNGNGATFDINGLVLNRLFIQIQYDYACYRGYFESFDLTESADSPFKFTYTITFKSEKTVYTYLR